MPGDDFAFPAGSTLVTSSPTPTSVGVQWPALDGAISYTVTTQPGGARNQVAAPATSAIMEGLAPDTAYDVSVTATSATETTPALTSPQRTMPEPVSRVLVPQALPPAGATTTADAAAFLYNGPNPVQVGVDPAALTPERVGIVSGRIVDVTGTPLSGAEVSILEDGRLGHTVTSSDGMWDLAVNGGAQLTVDVTKPGYLPSQRTVDLDWEEWSTIDDIALVELDPEQTIVELDPAAPGDGFTSHTAAEVGDADGNRTARVLVRDGTEATLEFADGSTRPTGSLTISVTEYTEGPMGPMAMPGTLPDTTGYTYAVEATAAEAIAAGAEGVSFDQPVMLLTDNFLNVPVGTLVPIGTYSRASGKWETQPDGIVLEVVAKAAGVVALDADGDGDSDTDDNDILDLDVAERTELGLHYDVGDQFWRGELMHFSPHDYNYRLVIDPLNPVPDVFDAITGNISLATDLVPGENIANGWGTIDVSNQVLPRGPAACGNRPVAELLLGPGCRTWCRDHGAGGHRHPSVRSGRPGRHGTERRRTALHAEFPTADFARADVDGHLGRNRQVRPYGRGLPARDGDDLLLVPRQVLHSIGVSVLP